MLQRTFLLCFTAFLAIACTSSPTVSREWSAVRGLLASGGAARGSDSGGGHWSLSLLNSDVLLEVDGAEVRFLGAAPEGTLAYEHVEATETWRLQLTSGVAVCRGRALEIGGCHYRLCDGSTLLFDRRGEPLAGAEQR